MTEIHDIVVDVMDMTDDGRVWARTAELREGFEPVVGRYVIVGDEDADPRAARILDVTGDGLIRLEVLPGPIEAHRARLARA